MKPSSNHTKQRADEDGANLEDLCTLGQVSLLQDVRLFLYSENVRRVVDSARNAHARGRDNLAVPSDLQSCTLLLVFGVVGVVFILEFLAVFV